VNDETYSSEPGRWKVVLERDPHADGAFVYGVVTTGVYCRPHCASRRPKRDNVRFFDSWQSAESAGFRPCRRCAPQAASSPNKTVDVVVRACALIEAAVSAPTLKQLADEIGLSPAHFQRLFRKTLGVTPKQYAMEKRMGRVRDNLRQGANVTTAVYAAGFESGSRFYENATSDLGMKPSEYRKGGAGKTIAYAIARSHLGLVLVAATDRGVCRIDFGDSPEELVSRLRAGFPKALLQENDPALGARIAQALECLDRPEQAARLPLDIQGTAFQRQVWAALQSIPPGSTSTYTDIARRIGRPKAARAVARACASNTIAVIVPCHRVVRGDEGLGGYRWGLERKRAILEREAQQDAPDPSQS
jgi:AraC family transcriptional regulator of adaptative response/methylated-DNA-[protein]-cysteine methyltransferase